MAYGTWALQEVGGDLWNQGGKSRERLDAEMLKITCADRQCRTALESSFQAWIPDEKELKRCLKSKHNF
jgi:hypothetical protein